MPYLLALLSLALSPARVCVVLLYQQLVRSLALAHSLTDSHCTHGLADKLVALYVGTVLSGLVPATHWLYIARPDERCEQ